jgi:hypothetical protein
MKKTTSPQKAINLNCRSCAFDEHDKGNWRQQVEACTIIQCSLHEHRPLTTKTKAIQRELHLATLSDEQRAVLLKTSIKRRENMANISQPSKGM